MTEFDPEFDHVYLMRKDGSIEHLRGADGPYVEHSSEHDVLINDTPRRESEDWHALVDHSGQDRYHGAVMHASEQWGQWAIDDFARILDDDSVEHLAFTVTEVNGHDDNDPVFPEEPDYCETYGCAHEPAGWIVLYRTI